MTESTPPIPQRRTKLRRKLLFALVPVGILLAAGELWARAVRAQKGHSPFMTGSFRDQRIDLIRRGYPAIHHSELGYAPKPGFASSDNQWGVIVTIDDNGLRRNGTGPRPAGEPILAVGDSFTFGDQVADGDTWPARLQAGLGRPVWNGGVFGYSFAQTVMRAEQLLPMLRPKTLVVSFIADDIRRCELKKRFTEIPWFELQQGQLVLRNVPVPDTDRSELDRQYGRKLLGYSALADFVLANALPHWWAGDQREVRAHPPGAGIGLEISRLLLDRLAARCRSENVQLLLVLQGTHVDGDPSTAMANGLVQHAHERGLAVLDLASAFAAAAGADPSLSTRWFAGHMTAAGNAWVAERITATLR
jgi:hypothetical protein